MRARTPKAVISFRRGCNSRALAYLPGEARSHRASDRESVPADYTKLYLDRLKGQDAVVLKVAA